MIGNRVCLAIPYKNFKEKIRITKEYKGHKIEIYKDFILIIDEDLGGNLICQKFI